MPTYSYACTECDNRFDVVQAFTDDALTTCEKCSGRLRKLFNSVGVVFKGSGFYRTDSRNGSVAASDAKKDKDKPSESKSTTDSNGSADKKDTKSKDSVSTAAKSSSEKVA